MFYGIILMVVVLGFAGLPVLPVVIFGALAMVVGGYLFSRNRVVLNFGFVVIVFAVNHYMFNGIKEFQENMPPWTTWFFSEFAVFTVSGITMFFSALLGIIGQVKMRTDPEGLLKRIKDVERQMHEKDKK